jgi:opacity protein-like surface antigen
MRIRNHLTIKRSIVSLACAGSLAPAVPALAQGAAEYEAIDPQSPVTATRVIPGFGYRAKADLDDGGEFSELAFSVRGGPSFALTDDLKLIAWASYRFSHYDFDDFGVNVDPWENIHTFRATPIVSYTMNEQWSFYGGPSFGISGEEGADFSHSFTAGVLAGVSYKVHDKLSVGGGLGIFSQIEDNARLLPFITVNWEFLDHWNLRVGFSEVAASAGLGAEVTYDFNPQWKFGGGFQFQRKRFLLDEDGPIPSGVGEDKSVPIYAKVGWQATERTLLELIAGVTVGGQVTLEDQNETEIAEEDYDPSAIIGLRAVFTF